jgi:hypothetical protein
LLSEGNTLTELLSNKLYTFVAEVVVVTTATTTTTTTTTTTNNNNNNNNNNNKLTRIFASSRNYEHDP